MSNLHSNINTSRVSERSTSTCKERKRPGVNSKPDHKLKNALCHGISALDLWKLMGDGQKKYA